MASTRMEAVPSITKRKASELESAASIALIREYLASIMALKKADQENKDKEPKKAESPSKEPKDKDSANKDTKEPPKEAPPKPPLSPKYQQLFTNVVVAFSDLKSSNREAQVENEVKKTEVSKEKQQLNQFNLQLQNILYEKNHFLKEIKQCRDFSFNEKDHNLISIETFMTAAPTEVTSTKDPHQLMMNRLEWENKERKRLCDQIQVLTARKKALHELNANKQKFLATLPDKLNTITQASLPIQTYMGITTYRDAQLREVAQLLPTPLYNLFAQATAFKSVHASGRDIEVLIVGNYEEALALQAAKEPVKQEEPSVVIVAEEMKTSSPIHTMEDSDDEERELRHSTVLESVKLDDSQTIEDKSKSLSKVEYYKPFPLAVFIEFKSKEPKEKSIGIRFDYLPALFVTTAYATTTIPPFATPNPTPSASLTSPPPASSSSTAPAASSSSSSSTTATSSSSSAASLVEDRHLLANLFQNDTGLSSPNPATYLALPAATFSPPEQPCQGLPYSWTQWLTGSTATHPAPSPFTSLPATYTAVLSAVRARLVSRAAVRSQIESLAKLTVPALYNKRGFPLPTEFVLVMWKEIPRAAFEEVEHAPEPEDKGAADREEGECPDDTPAPPPVFSGKSSSSGLHFADDVSISGTHIPWEKVGARYFRAVFQRAETQVEALIELASDYPTRPPRFKLKTLLRLPSSSSAQPSSSTTSSSSSAPSSSSSSSTPSSNSSHSSHSHSSRSNPTPATSHVPHMSFPFANPLLPHTPAPSHLLPNPFGIPPHFPLLPHLANLHHAHPLHMSHVHMPPTVHATPSTTTIVFPHGTSNHLNSPLAPPTSGTSSLASSTSSTASISSKGKERDKEVSKEQAMQQLMQQQQIDQLERLLPADNHIKSIETEINTQTSEWLLDNDANNLLATQIRKLQQCLDVYFEVVVKESSTSGQPGTVREGKLCARTYRGRARLLPLVFNEAIGMFDQRSYS